MRDYLIICFWRFDLQRTCLFTFQQLSTRKLKTLQTFKPEAKRDVGLKGKGQEQRLTSGESIYLPLSLAYCVFMYMLSSTSEVRTILLSGTIMRFELGSCL